MPEPRDPNDGYFTNFALVRWIGDATMKRANRMGGLIASVAVLFLVALLAGCLWGEQQAECASKGFGSNDPYEQAQYQKWVREFQENRQGAAGGGDYYAPPYDVKEAQRAREQWEREVRLASVAPADQKLAWFHGIWCNRKRLFPLQRNPLGQCIELPGAYCLPLL